MIIGVVISFIAGWCYAFANIVNRKLKGVNPGLVILYPATLGSIGLLIFLLIRLASTGVTFLSYENNLAIVLAIAGSITDIGATVFHFLAFSND